MRARTAVARLRGGGSWLAHRMGRGRVSRREHSKVKELCWEIMLFSNTMTQRNNNSSFILSSAETHSRVKATENSKATARLQGTRGAAQHSTVHKLYRTSGFTDTRHSTYELVYGLVTTRALGSRFLGVRAARASSEAGRR